MRIIAVNLNDLFLLLDFVMAQENRDEHMAEFVKWVTNNGVDLKGLTVEKFNGMDYGLKTTKDLAVRFCTIV